MWLWLASEKIAIPTQISLKSLRQRIQSSGLPVRKILNSLLRRVLPFRLPGSVESVSFTFLVFSPARLSLSSGAQVALGHRGITGPMKVFTDFGYFRIAFKRVFVSCRCFSELIYWGILFRCSLVAVQC